MPPRHRLRPYFRPLRRGRDSIQLGLTAESGGLIVSGILPAEVELLELLVHPLTRTEVYAASAAHGVPAPRATELFDLLAAHGVLTTEPPELGQDIPPLGACHVVVSGSGMLSWSIRRALRSSGVGRVGLGTWAVEQQSVDDEAEAPPDLVVAVATGVVDPQLGHPWLDRCIPLLPVVDDHHRITVGPVVGPDRRLPCLRCLELTRADRDPARPLVVAQHTMRSERGERADSDPDRETVDNEGAGLLEMAVGAVAMVTHTVLAGRPVPPGVSVEVSAPWPRLDYRQWRRHDGCPHHVAASEEGREAGPGWPWEGVEPRDGTARVTMTG